MTAVSPATETGPPETEPSRRSIDVIRWHLYSAVAFLVVAVVAYLVTSLQLVWPDFLGGVAFLSFGRLTPVATNALIFGWLALGLLGVGYFIVRDATGTPLWGERAQLVGVAAGIIGVAGGAAAVLAGQNQGREYLELPLIADLLVAVALIIGAVVITRTVSAAGADVVAPSLWFLVAGSWWMALSFVVGNVPGLAGVNSAIQNWFFAAAFFLGGLLAMAAGAVYYVLSDDERHPQEPGSARLSRIGLWSLLFAAGWIGPRFLIHGPGPDWLETVAVVFSLLLFIPVWTIVTDLGSRIRGRWSDVAADPGLIFAVAGGLLLLVVPVQNVVQSLRSPGAVLQFTAWDAAFEQLLLFGALTFWLLAAVDRVLFEVGGTPGSTSVSRIWHQRLTLSGLALAVASMWIAGLQQGYAWVGGANSGELAAFGDGFANAVRPLEAWYALRAAGVAAFALGQVLLAIHLVATIRAVGPEPGETIDAERADIADDPETTATEPDEEDLGSIPPSEPITVGRLVTGAVALFILAAVAVFAVPSFEAAHRRTTLLGDARSFTDASQEKQGFDIYIREGCWYCHTQQVRPVITDVGLGAVSSAGDYAEDDPHVLGSSRIGPDLMHAGARSPTDSARWNADHIESPRNADDPTARRPWSIMPAYDYLSDEDLLAVALYISALE